MNHFNRLLSKAIFPVLLKYITLLVFFGLIILGFTATSSDASILKYLRNTNLGNLIVWSYWWPLIILLAVFFGRIWCMICPIEVVTTLFAKIGLRRKRPAWLSSGWLITILYIIILFIGINGFAIHRNPTYMAYYLLIILFLSIVVGSIFEKNTFCRYVCPIGYLLGIYSRLSFLGWRVRNKSVCDSCIDKSCIQKEYIYDLNNKSCGVDLYPSKIIDNADCILCAGCIKTCNKHKNGNNTERPNPQLTQIGFANDLFQLKLLQAAELVFVFVVSGFVIYEILVEWKVTKDILLYVPHYLSNYLTVDNQIASGLIKSIVIFVLLPFVIWVFPFVISKLFGATIKFRDYMMVFGISFIPIMAAAHISKAILKTTSRIPYFEYVFDDITGMSTAQKIVSNDIQLSQNPLIINTIVSLLITFFIIAGIWLSIRVVHRLNNKYSLSLSSLSYFLIPVIYGGIFLTMILTWRWL